MTKRSSALLLVALSLVAAGCGGGGGDDKKPAVTAKERIAACLEKQPEATQSDCDGWEAEDQLGDDGTHKGHESMG
ncbi:MAG: hypothetical protein JWM90_2861 [Thermoleophilia bacterium]|nr:hypothetical protein [Thermoleophilia bacterium]